MSAAVSRGPGPGTVQAQLVGLKIWAARLLGVDPLGGPVNFAGARQLHNTFYDLVCGMHGWLEPIELHPDVWLMLCQALRNALDPERAEQRATWCAIVGVLLPIVHADERRIQAHFERERRNREREARN